MSPGVGVIYMPTGQIRTGKKVAQAGKANRVGKNL